MVGRGRPLDRISYVHVSRDGRLIVAGSESGLVRVWRKLPVRRSHTTSHAAAPSATSAAGPSTSGPSTTTPTPPPIVYDAASGTTMVASPVSKATPVKDGRTPATLVTTVTLPSKGFV